MLQSDGPRDIILCSLKMEKKMVMKKQITTNKREWGHNRPFTQKEQVGLI